MKGEREKFLEEIIRSRRDLAYAAEQFLNDTRIFNDIRTFVLECHEHVCFHWLPVRIIPISPLLLSLQVSTLMTTSDVINTINDILPRLTNKEKRRLLAYAIRVLNVQRSTAIQYHAVQAGQKIMMTSVNWCDYILRFFLRKDQIDLFTDDLHEEHGDMAAEYGRKRADIWYWKQALCSGWPHLSARTKGWIQALLSGATVAAEEFVRRHVK
jgi:hypothetical protein